MTQFIDVSQGVEKEKKETVFTHCAHRYDGWVNATYQPKYYKKVVYLGKCPLENSDIFAVYNNNGAIGIYKGTKGDEFNNQ